MVKGSRFGSISGVKRTAAIAALGFGISAAAAEPSMPRYDHILVIIAENQSYGPMMAGKTAPNLKRLADTYGIATNFFAEVHPSEGNYVAIVGGSTFGIHDDDAFYCHAGSTERYCEKSGATGYPDHTIRSRSLVDQLEEHGLTWKGYFQDIPEPGSLAIRVPDPAATPKGRIPALYAAKHNGFISFARVQADPARAAKIVGFDQLDRDLAAGTVPNYAHIVPNQCDDMHGVEGSDVPEDCTK
ncbi:MAG TPA: alkaline phosphatase family protein, partial [Stellaceae bacterium]|nr:alkaline phosphatase family protein [Stellaceae bacterium]